LWDCQLAAVMAEKKADLSVVPLVKVSVDWMALQLAVVMAAMKVTL
jgi:hypothetical protein